jgi:hypothetical protein
VILFVVAILARGLFGLFQGKKDILKVIPLVTLFVPLAVEGISFLSNSHLARDLKANSLTIFFLGVTVFILCLVILPRINKIETKNKERPGTW